VSKGSNTQNEDKRENKNTSHNLVVHQ